MNQPLTDLSGRPIPTQAQKAAVSHVLAIPPIRQAWNQKAVEFFCSFGLNLAIAAGPQTLTANGPSALSTISDRYMARLDYVMTWAPDLILASTPYVFFTILNNQTVLNPFGRVAIYPRTGLSQLTFNTNVMLGSNSVITATGENTDAANTHFFGLWMHGWIYPIDASDD